MAPRSRVLAVAGLVVPVVLVVALVGGLALGAPPRAPPSARRRCRCRRATPTFPPLPPTPSPAPSATPAPSDSPPPAGVDPLLGSDGRLTLLLMGTDYRPAHPGNRTDAMMVVSIDPTTGKSAGFSVPRDISDFPLPKSGTYGPKVNGLYQHLEATMGDGGKGMKQAVRAGLRHRDRPLRADRVHRRHQARPQRRRCRRHPRGALLRPVLLGQQPPPRLGPAGGQEPPGRRRRPDLRPQPQGRQRLPACQAPAAAGDGGRGQGPEARARRPAASCSTSPRRRSGRTCRSTALPTCSRSTARSTWPRSIGRSSGRRSSRSAMAAPTTSWSSTSARSGSRTTSRPRGRSGRGPRPRLGVASPSAPPATDRRAPTRRCRRGPGWRSCASSRRSSGCGAGHDA